MPNQLQPSSPAAVDPTDVQPADRGRHSPGRIAAIFLVFGLVWIWGSDVALDWVSPIDMSAFWMSGGKGSLFVLLTAVLLYYLVRHELQVARRTGTLLQAVAEGTADAVFVKDASGKYLLLNTAAARFAGRPVAAILGHDDYELFEPASARLVMERDRQVMASGLVTTEEEELTSAGLTRTWLATKAPYRDEAGAVIGVIGIARDITDRKQAEREVVAARQAAERSLAQLRSVVTSLADGVIVADTSGNLLDWNPAAVRMHGFATVEEVRRPLTSFEDTFDLCPPTGENPIPVAEWPISKLIRGEAVEHLELVVRRRDTGLRIVISYNGAVVAGSGGGPDLLVLTLHDVTDRRAAEDAARAGELRLRELADAIPQIVWTAGPDGGVTHLNAKAAEYTGVRPEELTGWSWDKVIHPDDLARVVEDWTETVHSGIPHDFEFRIRRADGAYRWHVARQVPVRGPDGAVTTWYGTCTDIEDFKAAQYALAAERTLLRTFIDAIPDLVFTKDTQGRFGLCNRALLDFAGAKAEEELAGKTVFDLFPAEHARAYSEDDARVIRGGEAIVNREEPALDAAGHLTWRLVTKAPVRDAGGRITGLVGVSRDVTDRKHRQQALAAKEAQLRLFFEHVPVPVAMFDRQMCYLHVSRRWLVDFNLGERDLTGLSHFDVFTEIPENWKRVLERSLAGATERCEEDRFVRANGSVQWLRWEVRPWHQADGEVGGIIIFTEDISERKRADQALRESQERSRLAQEAGRVGIFDWDAVMGRSVWTAEQEAIYGLPPGGFGGAHDDWVSRIHPDDREWVLEELHLAVAQRRVLNEVEYRITRPDGETRWVTNRGRLSYSEAGTLVRLIGTTIDVTDRKRAEESLRASEERARGGEAMLSAVLDSLPVAVILADETGRLARMNRASERILGPAPLVENVDRYAAYVGYWPDTGRRIEPNEWPMARAVLHGETTKAVRVVLERFGDGARRHLELSAAPVVSDLGRRLGGVVACHDVTDRVAAEAALRESEARFRNVYEHAATGIGITDPDGRFLQCNPAYCAVLGRTEDELRSADLAALIHPDDRAENMALVRRLSAGEIPGYEIENRFLHQSGVPVWVQQVVTALHDDSGRTTHLMALVTDVTERRKADQALRESEERYRRLVEVLPAAVFVHDGERVTYCNPTFARLVGVEARDEVIGSDPFLWAAPEYQPTIRQRLEEMRVSGRPAPGKELRVVRRDGRQVPVYSVSVPIPWYGPTAFLVALNDLTERERSTGLLRSVLDSVNDSIFTIDLSGTIRAANPATEQAFGYRESELLGQNVQMLMPAPHRDEHDTYIANYLQSGIPKVIGIGREVEALRKDGSRFPAELTVTEFQLEGERHFTGVLRDTSGRKRLEDQFRQAQKMEAVGRLAGGVAHDFNNLLTVINGYTDLLLMELPPADTHRAAIAAIRDAGGRAARLTQQLLAFSRKAIVEPKILDLNELVTESGKLLRRLIGEDIELVILIDHSLAPVKADPGQLEQVIMNLAVNARDAMPTGGRLTIETRDVAVGSADRAAYSDLKPGRYALLTVTDTGTGMPEEVLKQVFEPFFTTKGVGKGTGLGLAVVHGVVKQSGGHIEVTSAVGEGTTFTLLFPATEEAGRGRDSVAGLSAGRGDETVLLVEDEDSVRAIVRLSLEAQGYTVLPTDSGPAALRLADSHPGRIHLLVTDVVMPEIGGRQLAEAVRARRPGVKVLYMSGYTDDAVVQHGVFEAADAFLQKPFTPLGLARKVRAVLDGAG